MVERRCLENSVRGWCRVNDVEIWVDSKDVVRCCWGDDDVEKMLLERKKVSERRVFVDSMSSSPEKMKFAGKDGDVGDGLHKQKILRVNLGLCRIQKAQGEQRSSTKDGHKMKSYSEKVTILLYIVESDFGVPGAITITNKHQKEFYLESITIEGFACGPVYFPCNSWVQSVNDHAEPRIFFSNQPYLPDQTPAGIKLLREKELRDLRGDGTGVRKLSDRIYDYDVYNDLGNPDRGNDFIRPLLGGQKIPYPRRCRTGRAPSDTDISAESRVEKPFPLYVPRDEQFDESKQNTFSTSRLKAVLHNLLPSMVASISKKHDFKGFTQIESLYSEGVLLKLGLQDDLIKKLRLPNLVTRLHESSQVVAFQVRDTPNNLSEDRFSWLRDDEFARQALAGVNPVSIEKLKVFPPVILDVPKWAGWVTGTLKPIAIELSLPRALPGSQPKRVLTPPVDATSNWKLASWLKPLVRTHAAMEPFILSAHRQLSAMHPIYKLLDPHMRYTLEINAIARQNLLNADGVIEQGFTPGRYCMEISAAAYKHWRFDLEGLPADLIRRGMTVPDPSQRHRLKLLIEDYPYASDGLLIWEAITKMGQT
ncbi:linoleate 13S-lipoxygenase 3-1, chloroplastic [Tanacetum coccineum]